VVAKTELRVVVILDDRCATALAPAKQRYAPSERHAGAERKLVRGRDVNELGVVRQSRDVDPFGIDLHRNDARAVGGHDVAERRVPRVFDGDAGAGLDDDSRDEIERLLCATANEDVVSTRHHSSGDGDMPGDRRPET